jgi:hypothetical protein
MKRITEALNRVLNTRPRLQGALREWAVPVGLPLGAVAAFVLPLAQGASLRRMMSFKFLALAVLVMVVAVLSTLAVAWMLMRLGVLPFQESD